MNRSTLALGCVPILFCALCQAQPLTTAFTFQGQLRNNGVPATGLYDARFRLYDAAAGGTQLGPTLCSDNLDLTQTQGAFTAQLDFGLQYAGQQRFIEVEARPDTGLGCTNATGFQVLGPRQPLTASPNATYSMTAGSATNAAQLNSQPAAFYQNAGNLTGTLPSASLAGTYSSTLNLSNASNFFTGSFAGNGTALTGMNASNIDNGTLDTARLPVPLNLTSAGSWAVHGWASATTGITYGLFGESSSTFGRGVNGIAYAPTGPSYGGQFESVSTSGTGVSGVASATTGTTYGGSFQALSTNGIGVYGGAGNNTGLTFGGYFESNSQSGTGAYGKATSTQGISYGGRFETASQIGRGVFGAATANNGINYGGRFESASSTGRGVYGAATAAGGFNYGGYFESASSTGRGVYAAATSIVGAAYGVHGLSQSMDGRGVYGVASALTGSTRGVEGFSDSTSGIGVAGWATAGSGATRGIQGYSNSTGGTGVFGGTSATSGTVYGVYGTTYSTGGTGVYGLAFAESGATIGGYFESTSPTGTGLFAKAGAGSGATFGLHAVAYSPSSYAGYFEGRGADCVSINNTGGGRGLFVSSSNDTAVWAISSGSIGVDARSPDLGVYGLATSAGGYGVVGETFTFAGYGVFSSGDLGASGFKSFRIDHPDDPEHKYLVHYSTESAEVLNFYSGKAVLDERGECTVTLPPYFARINKDPRYLLTPIGAPMPMLHVAEEISDDTLEQGSKAAPHQAVPSCSFRIAGGVPGGKVSWRVEALRNDRWVQAHGAPVEVGKDAHEDGTYQHPEFYDQPPEKGTFRRAPAPVAAPAR